MKHEKTFRRENGKRVKIEVSLHVEGYRDTPVWDVNVTTCEKRKRNFLYVFDSNGYEYRQLPFGEERVQYKLNAYLKHCTSEEIKETKQELINSIPLD